MFFCGGSVIGLSSDQNKWYVANKLSFNIEKTCYSAFLNDPSNRNDYSSINLKINAAKIKMCDSVKYLEVWIDDKLNWKIHIDYIYLKLAKFVGLFYKLSHELPPNCLKMLYFSFAHPHICLLYTSPSPRDRQKSRMPSSA